MFARLAKLPRLVNFRRAGPRHLVPPLCDVVHSNDNLPGFRRPAATGRRRPPTPALACHWFNYNGRLECRWRAETSDTPTDDSDEHHRRTTGRASGRSSMQPRGRGLALTG
jgi:hypothetical protein